ncbi:Dabb family protein [Ruminiclostridium cellulolyticum]|uniref:Stress responsive alpha-beta barrel domain protein n=1 Tax=Ruminiclostridium cellulolyticum (strain ATCC 35319 / DSM 5812 / JCM 6584 / H10) TaxID=394503 RepID=B8I196_RUMCH|nr:Dabb family protein [Ruminiclostridium cellulolyticum]ACL75694.1 Stress responsive alpha-beta barrel domain protein [Ruminiclostridium cellulolyticum H10]
MFTHIVLFKLKDKSEETIQKTKDLLLGLKGQIPCLKFIEVGINVIHSERSYDLGLYAKFDSRADMEAYQVHPAHLEVVEYIKLVNESSIAVDYES